MKPQTYQVRVVYDVRSDGETFGPFSSVDGAEACVIALASRPDVRSATIESLTDGGG